MVDSMVGQSQVWGVSNCLVGPRTWRTPNCKVDQSGGLDPLNDDDFFQDDP